MNYDSFSAGWRPAIGWTCQAAILVQYVLRPLSSLARELVGGAPLAAQPDIAQSMIALILTILGMAALRSADKAVAAKAEGEAK